MPVNTSGVRGSKNSCCRVCEEGTYRPYLSQFLQCLPCPPGYFCPPGTTSHPTQRAEYCCLTMCVYQSGTGHHNNYSCPLGHVCPLGSSQPAPCPPGSFGNLTRAEAKDDCHPCPADTFNHLPAQEACFPCGSSSTSPAGSYLPDKQHPPSSKSVITPQLETPQVTPAFCRLSVLYLYW